MMSTKHADATTERTRQVVDLEWHAGAFLVLNAFFWALDVFLGQSGVQWAFWITLFWGLGLAFHALTVVVQRPRKRSG
jgi:hypothetical protein